MHSLLNNTILPHYCCSCGKIGALLCDYCKYDIVNEISAQCFACLRPVGRYGDVCSLCNPYYSKGWFVGVHKGVPRELIARFKFERTKSAATVLASLMDSCLPQLPDTTLVTHVPTIGAHIRMRGYDHAALLAKEFAQFRGLATARPLCRLANTRQRGAKRSVRISQAQRAFAASGVKPQVYLLIDDVSTTGATVNYAAKALKNAGAQEVWVATLTREPLD